VLPDHGRGVSAKWTDHGEDIPESREMWMDFPGPDIHGLGERREAGTVTESQVAATLAALLGEGYHASVPKSGVPIEDVLGKQPLPTAAVFCRLVHQASQTAIAWPVMDRELAAPPGLRGGESTRQGQLALYLRGARYQDEKSGQRCA